MYFTTGVQLEAALAALPTSKVGTYVAFDAVYYAATYMAGYTGTLTPIDHFVQIGAIEGSKPNAEFDPTFYRSEYTDLQGVGLDGADLLYHFMQYGLDEGRAANETLATFDATAYLAAYPDVAEYVNANLAQFGGSASNGALAHFVKFGDAEGRTAVYADPDAADLTESLVADAAAHAALADFEAGLDLDDDADTDEDAADVVALLGAGEDSPLSLYNDVATIDLEADSSAASIAASYAVARSAADDVITAQAAVVANAQAAVDALDAAAEVAAYEAALVAQTAAVAATLEAASNLAAAVAYSNTQAQADAVDAVFAVAANGTVTFDADGGGAGLPVPVIELNTDDELVLVDGVTEENYVGITALLAASVAKIAADVAETAADTAVDTAAADLDAVDGLDGVEIGAGAELVAVEALVTAKENLALAETAAAGLEVLITDLQEAYALNAELAGLNDAVEEIADGFLVGGTHFDIANAGYNLYESNGVAYAEVAAADDIEDAAESDNDVYVFDGETGGEIVDFGTAGTDLLYVGSGFTLVALEDTDNIAAGGFGSDSALEIFVKTVGGDTTLYIESAAFGGTAVGGDDVVTIQLTGVTDDVALSYGYIQMA